MGKVDNAYESKLNSYEDKCCWCICCKVVQKCFNKMPEVSGHHDGQMWFWRITGLFMIYIGLNMFMYPLYFILHMFWFMGVFFAGHIFFCMIKLSCCAWTGTIGTSYVVHRPAALACLVIVLIGLIAVTIYFTKHRGGHP